MIFKYAFMGVLLTGLSTCSSPWQGDTAPKHQGQYLSRHYAYAPPRPPNMNEIANTAPDIFQAHTAKEQMMSTYIWDAALQKGLNKAIRETPTDLTTSWNARYVDYKLNPSTDLHYSTVTESLCREGTLHWQFQYFADSRDTWENLTMLFCQIGPNGEWLPVT